MLRFRDCFQTDFIVNGSNAMSLTSSDGKLMSRQKSETPCSQQQPKISNGKAVVSEYVELVH